MPTFPCSEVVDSSDILPQSGQGHGPVPAFYCRRRQLIVAGTYCLAAQNESQKCLASVTERAEERNYGFLAKSRQRSSDEVAETAARNS